jgi:TRAP-type C4-dicarboxylate transport system substrate-binding protein
MNQQPIPKGKEDFKMRKGLLGIILCVFLIGIVFPFGNSASGQTIELKMSHFMPTKHVQDRMVMRPWAEKIEKLTNGKAKVTLFPGGALGKPPHQYDNAMKGITDIAFGLQSYTPGRFPLTSSLRLPFMVKSARQGSEVLWHVYEKYLKREYKDVKVLWMFMHGPGQLFTTKKQVKALEDLKGLKIRSPGPIMSKVLRQVGAVPVNMPITQVYTALERRTVDGVVVPWEVMRPFRFYERCKYATVADIYSMTFFVVMNKAKFNSLSADVKEVIEKNSGMSMSIVAGSEYDSADKPGKEIFLKNGGIIYQLPSSERERWKNAVIPVKENWLKEMKAKGLPGEEVLNYAIKMLKE